ncbi:SAV_2336 N-terminal domain-related protein [Streptomyces sp. NPDC050560]|uniref:SAV_2336 N-terminal domain-related protein n=1 Tax=Streptomyces sp. NPDC050560 TaxID=3365630 RepID=UPI003789BAD6
MADRALSELISRMREADIPPSVEEMADALWLARWLPAAAADGPADRPRGPVERNTPPQGHSNGRGFRTLPPHRRGADEDAEPDSERLFAPEAGGDPGQRGLRTVQVPAAPALPEPLSLQRGLRILQRYRAPVRPVPGALDEGRTADRAAESGLVQPVMRSERRREARLLLVMDVSTSTMVWQQALDELRQVCERAGAFREVRVQYLHAGEDGWPGCSATPQGGGPLHAPEQLSDPTGRRLTLLLSDCAGPMWRSGGIHRMLYRWASTAPVAVVQPLPQRMWRRTHLPAVRGILHRREGPAGRLVFTPERQPVRPGALPVPVLALRRSSVEGWARLVAGSTGQSLTAAAGWVQPLHPPATSLVQAARELSGADRVRAFSRQASPEARRLASYLSAVPLFLPVMQLVQHAMLAGTGPDVLSEVLLGGLVRRRDTGEDGDPRTLRYDFLPGVAKELRGKLPVEEAELLFKHCSEYVERHFGRVARNFPALAAGFLRGTVDPAAVRRAEPPLDGHEEPAGLRAFAEVAGEVLRDLGSRTRGPRLRPPDPRLGTAELLERGRDALAAFEAGGLIRDLDDAVALCQQAGAVAAGPAERATAAEELANALLTRWRIRRVGDDLRDALSVLGTEPPAAPRAALLRGTVHWVLAGALKSSWLGVDDLPADLRAFAQEYADAERPGHLWAYSELLRRAADDLARVIAAPPLGERPSGGYDTLGNLRTIGSTSSTRTPHPRAGDGARPPSAPAGPPTAGPGRGGQHTGEHRARPSAPAAPSAEPRPQPRGADRQQSAGGDTGAHPRPAEAPEPRLLAAETLPTVLAFLAEWAAPLAAPAGPFRAAGPEDWYLTQLERAAVAAAARLDHPAPERGRLTRGRIRLDLARQYLGRGPVAPAGPPDEERAAEHARLAGDDFMAALREEGALPADESCRAWLDLAATIEITRPAAGAAAEGEHRPVLDAVSRALAAAGEEPALLLDCHTWSARLHRDHYEATGHPAELNLAIAAWQEATALLGRDDPGRPGILAEYGGTLNDRAELHIARGGPEAAAEDAGAAVRALATALDWTPGGDPDLANRRRLLGVAHHLRFRSQEEGLTDLYEADWIFGEAAREATAADDTALAADCWLQRGTVTMELAARLGSPHLLQRAEAGLRTAAEYAAEAGDTPRLARSRQLRGLLLERRGDTDLALAEYRSALDAAEPPLDDDIRRAVSRLTTGDTAEGDGE